MMSTVNILFAGEERGMIRRAAMAIWDKASSWTGSLASQTEVPNVDPEQDNDPRAQSQIQDLREPTMKGIRASTPSLQRVSKAFEIQQEK